MPVARRLLQKDYESSMWPFSSSKESAAGTAPSAHDASGTSESPADYLRAHSFERVSGAETADAPTAAGLLKNTALDPALLHPLANLKDGDLEYLNIEDDQPNTLEGARTALPSRGWTDDLCYGTGTTYLGGLAIGGLMGLREGLTRPLGIQSPTVRLRMNAVLNQVTRRGSFIGNSAGVIALTYNLIDATIDAFRGKHDMFGSIAAGGLSGALFRCTAGPRPMLVSSSIMMAAAATWTTAKRAFL
ncbi:Mitochondrial import inner membrane translocase subunit tim23 [Malassezia sp. CBS 17886]|nr:Mitochondrial import inner membrane translocase subunit tim23 [Malassezia sp. CBS 17886]